ncbi:restriction endonuclease [Microvirga sp. CF3062]|uniref:restriction endonuclease n=1 Tax=Microvirga sp. CF3062 TaxID=3110182 RepID=UPI002E76BC8E|nr:restriction endonuclease [Microvirga sp. CF3062]MEE1655693.1 restriction endonuclease [Microvirga sp. CF3062]
MTEAPAWRVYERVAACFEIESADMDVSVTPNATLVGSISGVRRQIDILVDARWDEGVERRVIYDAKRRTRKIDVKDVEAFGGMMKDVRASRGVLICSNGWTPAAEKRAAENIDIRLMTADEAEELDHAAIDPCPHCRALKRKTEGIVFWDGQFPLPLGGWAIVFTGKCDTCRSFAFWCWDCGEKLVVPDNETHECGCERTWFIEKGDDEAVFIVRTEEGEVPLDRRPLT